MDNGEQLLTNKVVVATPAYVAAEICGELDPDGADALAHIAYADIAVVCTGYNCADVENDVNGFGFLVPRTEQKRMLGCLWTSSIFPAQAPDGTVLLRTMVGGYTDPDAVALNDEQILALVMKELTPIMGINASPTFTQIYRWKRGIPQYLIGHGILMERIEATEQRNPGLVFAGNAYRGVGLNDCVVSAHRAVDMLKN